MLLSSEPPGQPEGPWQSIVLGGRGGVSKDGRSLLQSSIKTPVLCVEILALQSYREPGLPAGPIRHLQGSTNYP